MEDAALDDAVNETEDHSDPMIPDEITEGLQEDRSDVAEQQEGLPNNDFCFTEADYLETRKQMNDATRHHQGSYHDAWTAIKALEGYKLVTTSTKMGSLKWTVVSSESVVEDEFVEVRKNELRSIHEKVVPMISDEDLDKFTCENDFNAAFWSMWPTTIDDDVKKLNDIISTDNPK